jgi:hypothetical protein
MNLRGEEPQAIKSPEDMEFSSQIDKVIWQQSQMIYHALSIWQVFGAKQVNHHVCQLGNLFECFCCSGSQQMWKEFAKHTMV